AVAKQLRIDRDEAMTAADIRRGRFQTELEIVTTRSSQARLYKAPTISFTFGSPTTRNRQCCISATRRTTAATLQDPTSARPRGNPNDAILKFEKQAGTALRVASKPPFLCSAADWLPYGRFDPVRRYSAARCRLRRSVGSALPRSVVCLCRNTACSAVGSTCH